MAGRFYLIHLLICKRYQRICAFSVVRRHTYDIPAAVQAILLRPFPSHGSRTSLSKRHNHLFCQKMLYSLCDRLAADMRHGGKLGDGEHLARPHCTQHMLIILIFQVGRQGRRFFCICAHSIARRSGSSPGKDGGDVRIPEIPVVLAGAGLIADIRARLHKKRACISSFTLYRKSSVQQV